jgi:hypothetical protein
MYRHTYIRRYVCLYIYAYACVFIYICTLRYVYSYTSVPLEEEQKESDGAQDRCL